MNDIILQTFKCGTFLYFECKFPSKFPHTWKVIIDNFSD